MSWNRPRGSGGRGGSKPQWGKSTRKQKAFLSRNKKFTGILLLVCLGVMVGVHLFMWQLHDKTCDVSCSDPSVGCVVPVGYLGLFGPCHGFNAKTNETQAGMTVSWQQS